MTGGCSKQVFAVFTPPFKACTFASSNINNGAAATLKLNIFCAVAEGVVVEGQNKPLQTRVALNNTLIWIDRLPEDLRFWAEVYRFVLSS